MMRALRPRIVEAWRWFTGPASVLTLFLVGLYVAIIRWGAPLLGFWWILETAITVGSEASASGATLAWLTLRLGMLGFCWWLARRLLPPFRWRY